MVVRTSSSSSSSSPPPVDVVVSVPDCSSNRTGVGQNLSACLDQTEAHLCQTFSSTAALIVLFVLIVSIIVISLLTFHFHKCRMKRRKIQRAQEEYERDACSPKAVKAGKLVVKQCIMVRPATGPRPEPVAGSVPEIEGSNVSPIAVPVSTSEDSGWQDNSRLTKPREDQDLESGSGAS